MNLQERIAHRKSLGLTAEEYNRRLADEKLEAERAKHRAVRDCILAGMKGTPEEVDAALERLGKAELALASYQDSPLG